MNSLDASQVTADQRRVFSSSMRWRDFRSLFPTTEQALSAHLHLCQEAIAANRPVTHEIEWRFIYHDDAAKKRQLLALLLVPMGVISTHHAQVRFTTRHAFSRSDVWRIGAWRSLATLAYYACFVAIIGCGIGLVYPIFALAFRGVSFGMIALLIASLVAIVALLIAAAKTRSLGLSGPLRLTAKDAFDLLSIRRIKSVES